jgi:hypothetical protein
MLRYLLRRLTQAQGFTSHVHVPPNLWTRSTDPDAIIKDAQKKVKSVKGGKGEILLHRYYGKGPAEGSSSVTIILPVQFRDGEMSLVPGEDIKVSQPTHKPGRQHGWMWESDPIVTTRPKATWMAILGAVDTIREPRKQRAPFRNN